MQLDSNLTYHQKLLIVNQNRHLFDITEIKNIANLQQSQSLLQRCQEPTPKQALNFSKYIRLQTFYKCCIPAHNSLHWQQEIHYQTTHPITGIVAFKQIDQTYYSVDQKIVTWVESGGTKVVPLKSNSSQDKIVLFLKNIHALIIPQFKGQPEILFFQILTKLIQFNKDLPILAMGNSALLLMSEINNCQQFRKRIKLDIKFHNDQIYAFASHKDPFFADLNLKTRIQIENKTKVLSSSVHLPLEILIKMKDYERINVMGLSKSRADQWGVLMAKEQLVHYCFIEPRLNANNMEAINFYHKTIINFLQQVRKRQKKVQQKQIQIGQYKMIQKNDKYIYNCDLKIAKI